MIVSLTEAAVRDGPRSDTELWRLIAADDHQAFTELFERHAQTIWNYAYKLTASWSALPWLYTVTANLRRGERRRLSRFLRLVPKLATTDSAPDHAEQVAQDSATRARLQRVLAAIERLSPKEREAVEVCLLGGTSPADAAELFGISETSVRSRLSRARSRLHELSQETADE